MTEERTQAEDDEKDGGSPPAPSYRVADQGEGRYCDACFHRAKNGMRCSKYSFGAKRGYRPDGVCEDFARRSVVQDRADGSIFFDGSLPSPDTEVGEFGQTIKDVEVFRSGAWNGHTYTGDDLDEMIGAFDRVGYVPPVKLGHDDDPKAPAYGWVQNLRRRGDTLVADFTDVPDDMVELIRDGRFDAVSSEIFFNLKRNGDVFPKALKAVAILGAHPPGVSNLKPLRSSLTAELHAEGQVRSFDIVQHRREAVATNPTTPDNQPGAGGQQDPQPGTGTDQQQPPAGGGQNGGGNADAARSLAEAQAKIAALTQQVESLKTANGSQTDLAFKLREMQQTQTALQRQLEEVAQERRAERKAKMVNACRVPSFRELIAAVAEMALDRDEAAKTVTFTISDGKGNSTDTQIAGVKLVEKLTEEINKGAALLFGEIAGFAQDYGRAERGSGPRSTLNPGDEVHRRAKDYQTVHPGVSYSEAFHAVLEDPNNALLRRDYEQAH